MAERRIRIDAALYERVAAVARAAGYSEPEEFIRHVLERELSKIERAGADESVEERLRGLGYIE